jgi:hypothetical protein
VLFDQTLVYYGCHRLFAEYNYVGGIPAGLCLLLAQMLPLAPAIMGAYSPFAYEPKTNSADRGDTLWLGWDRGTLGLFGHLAGGPLGFKDHGLFDRYGDVYVDPAQVERAKLAKEPYAPILNTDDFLYYHWYRRWEFVRWQTGRAQGPVPDPDTLLPGVLLVRGRQKVQEGFSVRIEAASPERQIPGFPEERLGEKETFLAVDVRLKPTGTLPATVDSAQFVLLGPDKERFTPPLVHGKATGDPKDPRASVARSWAPVPAQAAPRNLQFAFSGNKTQGHYLMDGAAFTFTDEKQEELRTFIFVVPKPAKPQELRLLLKPPSAAAPPAPAPPAPAK